MVLPVDWQFNDDHTDLDEAGALNTGEGTLVDWAATCALTTPGDLPEDPTWGAGFGDVLGAPMGDPREIGEGLRGHLYADERVGDVAADAVTDAGAIVLPVRIEAAEGPYRLSGTLTPELIEEIIADMDFT